MQLTFVMINSAAPIYRCNDSICFKCVSTMGTWMSLLIASVFPYLWLMWCWWCLYVSLELPTWKMIIRWYYFVYAMYHRTTHFCLAQRIKRYREICTFLSNACLISLKWNNTMACWYTLEVLYLQISRGFDL